MAPATIPGHCSQGTQELNSTADHQRKLRIIDIRFAEVATNAITRNAEGFAHRIEVEMNYAREQILKIAAEVSLRRRRTVQEFLSAAAA